MSQKFAVVSYGNYGAPERCTVFFDYDKASAYLHWLWEIYLNDEIANGSHLVDDECYHEDISAVITWEDKSKLHLVLIPITGPFTEFSNVDWKQYAPK